MQTVTAPRFVVLARNAVGDLRLLGTVSSETDAEVLMAEQRIRHPGLSYGSARLYGVRQAAMVAAELLALEAPDTKFESLNEFEQPLPTAHD
jgi:hypothetical protein